MSAWHECRIGSCQRHRNCMYAPCRSASAPPIKVGDRAPMPPAPKLEVRPSRDADVGGKSLRGAFCNGKGGRGK